MPQIDVDFEVWKALTVRRATESHGYNDVLRDMLGLSALTPELTKPVSKPVSGGGRTLGGRFLPNGSQLRATYKGVTHHAEISKNRLVGADGKIFASASAAATAITGTNVNGLAFWEAKRPTDEEWRKLMFLPRSQ